MHILVLILMFVFGSIAATCKGDWSGMAAIGNVILGVVGLIVFLAVLNND